MVDLEIPIQEKIRLDFQAYRNFETEDIPGWMSSEEVNTLYFPYGGDRFLQDAAAIFQWYFNSRLNLPTLIK